MTGLVASKKLHTGVVRLLGSSGRLLSGQLNQFIKGRLVPNGHISQDLPVQLYTRQLHSVHELTVCSSGGSARRADPDYPKPPKVAFLFPAVTIGMGPSNLTITQK